MKDFVRFMKFNETVLYQVPFGILTCDLNGDIITMNKLAKQLLCLERSISELEGKTLSEVVNIEKLINVVRRILEGKRKSFNLQRIPIGRLFINIRGKKLEDRILITLLDTTESVKAMDVATQSIILGQEQERARLARELHDGIGPMMSSIRLQIDALSSLASNDKVKLRLSYINEMISETSKDIRLISHDLMPQSLKDFGLNTAVSNLVKRLNDREDHAFQAYYSYGVKNVIWNHQLEINLYRIIQELINNAIKYAQCSEIQIQIRNFDDQIQLTVEDNGKGATDEEMKSGMGLNNIATRVKTLQGTLEVETRPNDGFSVQILVPVNVKND
ncbi:sensor histidine kinase [Portibacter marinus]|uniref:sensor histidine kinase n=1 Tax=Portibacter marinus TaxID=2898660 RepID=UPI001F1D811B|nr:sensor histidine kinase [Portibacter marinus]